MAAANISEADAESSFTKITRGPSQIIAASLSSKTSLVPSLLATCTTGPSLMKSPAISTAVLREPPPLFLKSSTNPSIPSFLRLRISFLISVAALRSL